MAERTNSARGEGEAKPSARRSVLGGLTALGILLAIVVGLAWLFLGRSGYWPGSSVTTVWETPTDTEAPEGSTHQAWLVDDTLVRARYDAVTGFDAGSGEQLWEFAPPRRTDICAVSRTADDARVLIAYTDDGSCATVAALDLSDGRELWHTDLALAIGTTADGLDALAVGGGLGVVLDGTEGGAPAVRAVDLRTGASFWTAAMPGGCVPVRAATAPDRVLAVLACGEEMKVAAFAPADGAELWTRPLDARRGVAPDANVTITATEPIVLRVDEGDRGIDAFLAFGPDGRPGARVQVSGDDYGSIGTEVAVSEGRLFAVTDGDPWGRLVAFDLTTGDELWQDDEIGGASYEIRGLHAQGGRVMAVKSSARYGDHLHVFDAATGDEEERRAFRENAGAVDDLFPYGDRVIAVRSDSRTRPFTGYERW